MSNAPWLAATGDVLTGQLREIGPRAFVDFALAIRPAKAEALATTLDVRLVFLSRVFLRCHIVISFK